MSEFALDASAVLAYLNRETGWQRVESLLLDERCLLLSVNLTEVLSRLADWGVPLAEAEARLAGMGLNPISFDYPLASLAAQLRPPTRHLGLSLADRACLALAKARGIPAVTSDQHWQDIAPALGIAVECIR
ncbi:MAG: type II toxin-antitoxin system VapC family toxin [Gammaproteobacteria bacterium]|nr:type II toxin-antitoxin system VapC family toxin [Gammaproteobacteria bacterium]